MQVGRPTAFKEEYCDMLVDHMSQMLSYESFAGVIGVCRATIYHWEKIHPKFSDAKKRGQAKLLLSMEKLGLEGITGDIKSFNASTYIFTMKNKCGWVDKAEVEQTNKNIEIKLDTEDVDL